MAVKFEKIVKDTVDTMKKASKPKTSEYDVNGIVKRVDGKTAWVHFDGGIDETPVRMTISARKGDKVRVHVGGGKAYITGNETAPPTDDGEARKATKYAGEAKRTADDADAKADKAQKSADEAMNATESLAEDVEDISDMIGDGDESGITVTTQYYLSTSNTTQQGGQWVDSLPTYVSGRYYWTRTVTIYADGSQVEGTPKLDVTNQIAAEVNAIATATDQHFWHDSTGAYVTRSNKNVSSDYAMKFTNQGILQTYNGKNLMALTSSALSFFQSDGSTLMASYTSSGSYLYAGGSIGASFTTSEARIYAGSTNYASVTGTSFGLYSGSEQMFSVTNSGFLWLWDSSNSYTYTTIQPGTIKSYNNGQQVYSLSGSYGDVTFAFGGYSIRSQRSVGFTFDGEINASYGMSVSRGATISGGATIYSGLTISSGGLDVTGDTTVKKLYVGTPGTAESSTANCRIATGENNRIMFTGSSSRRVKHDIKPVREKGLDPHKLYDADVIQFIYNLDYLNDKDERYNVPVIGFVAEDLQKVYPIAVDTENGKAVDWNYRYIVPPMLVLIQEQKKEIDHLTDRVKMLEERSA